MSYVDNWSDTLLAQPQYWAADRLHMGPVGHQRVASRILRALEYEVPADWTIAAPPIPQPTTREQVRYAGEFVAPWIRRRLTGRSSGDGRGFKIPGYVRVEPRTHTAVE